MADLPELVTVGDANHPGLHRDERAEINSLRRRAAGLEAGRSIAIRGELTTTDQLPATGQDREGWLVAGRLWAWDPATGWTDRGSVQGPAGPQGRQGIQGVQGVAGPKGDTGPAGATGATGPQGVKGDPGATGQPGAGLNIKGNLPATTSLPATGATGDAYIIGTHLWVWQSTTASWLDVGVIPQGPQGVAGPPGATGPAGVKGDKGDPGPAGPQGVQGVQGVAGPAASATTDASQLTTGTLSANRLPTIPDTKLPDLSARYVPAAFDITRVRPHYLTSLELATGNVLQGAVLEPVSGNYFASQSYTSGSFQTCVVSRVGADGTLLDSMTLTNAGHGTTVAVQRSGASTYLFLAWEEAVAGGTSNDLVRIAYRPGATLTRSQTTYFTVLNRFGDDYSIVALDGDWMAYRQTTTTTETFVLRKMSEVLAGKDIKYGTVGPLPMSPPTPQGFATIDGVDLYRYTGNSDQNVDLPAITRYSWATGKLTGTVSAVDLGRDPDGTYPGGFMEPEGISLYRDPTSGAPALLAGVTVGEVGSRQWRLFAYESPTAPGLTHLGTAVAAVERRLTVAKDGSARARRASVTSLAGLDQPGWYYLPSADMAKMTDQPAGLPSAGWWVEVSGYDTGATVHQRLVRNSSATPDTYQRTINTATGTRSNWHRVGLTSVAYA